MPRPTRDLTGQVFSRLTVIERSHNSKDNKAQWLCKCTCGNEKVIIGYNLVKEKTKSCGCFHAEASSNRRKLHNQYMINKTFGKLTVKERSGLKSNGHQLWRCVCECGGERITTTEILKAGGAISCGCIQAKNVKKAFGKFDKSRINNVVIPTLKKKVAKNNTTGYKGVSILRKNGNVYYRAHISLNNNRKYLGTFVNLEDAIKARKEGEVEYHKPLIDIFENTK